MSKFRHTFILVVILTGVLVMLSVNTIPVHAATSPAVGTIKVMKSVPGVSLSDEISVVLTIQNNGTVPVFDLQVYEYMNANLPVKGGITIEGQSRESVVQVAPGGLTSVAQVIVDPPPPNTLMPGEKITLKYTQVAPKPGDFQIPTSLVWYSYNYGGSIIRLSVYSNGLLVHVLNYAEKAAFQIYPYILSAATFSSTMMILLWARRKLARLKRGILH